MVTSSLGIALGKTNLNIYGHTFLPAIAHDSAMNKSTRPAARHLEKIGPGGIHTKIMKTIATMIGTLCVCAPHLLAADPSSVVHIPDPELQSVIRDTLGKPEGDITAADMESLTVLDASIDARGAQRPAITSLEGLAAAINLRTLNFASFPLHFIGSPDPTVLDTTELSALSNLTRLENLDLSAYEFAATATPSLPNLLGALTNLQSLRLADVSLTDGTFLTNLSALRSLDLSSTGLTNVTALTALPHLEDLRLYDVDLADVAFLNGLSSLRSLYLGHNWRLENISIPSGLNRLRELHLVQVGMTNLSLPDDLTNLHTLNLSVNGLTDLSFLGRVPNLQKLDANSNNLRAFPDGVTNLVELDLRGNAIDDFTFLTNLLDLETLYLFSSPFRSAHLELLRHLPRLRELHLGSDSWNSAVVPEGFPELESLTIRNAWLQSISVGFLPKLRRIDLGQNQLTNAELAGVRHSLEHVDLSANRLNDVNFLQGFSQLKTLDMYSHNLTTLTLPWGLVNLRELGLWHETASLDAPEDNPSLRIKFKPVRPIPSPYVYLGVPASTDLEHLVIYGIPKSRASVLGFFMPSPIRRADGSVALRIRGANGRSVQVQRSSNLMDWESWQTVMLGENGAELSWDQPVALQFFRVSENGTD